MREQQMQRHSLGCRPLAAPLIALLCFGLSVSAAGENGRNPQQGVLGMSNAAAAALAVTALCGLLAVLFFFYRRLTSPSESNKPLPQAEAQRRKKTDRLALEQLMAGGPPGGPQGGPLARESPDSGVRAAQRKKEEREQRREERRQQGEAAAAASAAVAAAADGAGESEEEAGPPVSYKQAKQEAYRRRQAERDRIREEQEAEEERKAEEQRKKEQEEYEEWKKAFKVEAEGELEISPEKEAQELERFLAFIRMRKAVELEEIAAEFALKTKECIKRIESLQESGRLCGVLDDRGRFLCLTEDELQKVAAALKAQGRFSKETDLVAVCNRIIRLTPSEEDKKRIEEEQLSSTRLVELAAADD